MNKKTLILLTLLSITNLFSQDFLRTQDKEIINDNGPVLLRSIGTGMVNSRRVYDAIYRCWNSYTYPV